MLKSSRKALSLELLTKHQQYLYPHADASKQWSPKSRPTDPSSTSTRDTVDIREPKSKKECRNVKVHQLCMSEMSDKLFEENMKLIYRIETTGPKVETKKFPSVSPNPKRIKSLSQRSHNTTRSNPKFKIMDTFRN